MLDNLRGTFEGMSFAVLGSAPSLPEYFRREQDVIIGVNGASQILCDGDIFFSADQFAFTRSWYYINKNLRYFLRGLSAIHSDKLYPNNIFRNMWIEKHNIYINSLPTKEVFYRKELEVKVIQDGSFFDNFFSEMPEPQNPHGVIHSISHGNEPISRNQNALNVGGTSACTAIQLAYVMGAREIHLYGVEFSNPVEEDSEYGGGNYFYESKPFERGRTLPSQRDFMDKVIMEMANQNMNIFCHGKTNLKNCSKIII